MLICSLLDCFGVFILILFKERSDDLSDLALTQSLFDFVEKIILHNERLHLSKLRIEARLEEALHIIESAKG